MTPKKTYIVQETCRYRIEAESMQEAQRIWLEDLTILSDDTQPLFVDVTDRSIECVTPDENGELSGDVEEF